MIIPGELEQAYNRIIPTLKGLQARSFPLLRGAAISVGGRLLNEGRIKPPESLLLKIEKDGPVKPFEEINDLFATMIVVPNETLIPLAEEEISKRFEIIEKVPPKTKRPEQFIYDDRHLILKLKREPGREDPELESIQFELQIKTEMQFAASAISRQLSYKTRWLSWAGERLASRIRALVEMVDDLLIRLAESLEDADGPPKEQYETFASRNSIIELLDQTLASEQMPEDRRRLAITIENYLNECKPKMSIENFKEILQKPVYSRIREATSLSAAGSVFIILFLEGKLSTHPADARNLRGNRRYLITSEMIDFCPSLREVPEDRRVHLK